MIDTITIEIECSPNLTEQNFPLKSEWDKKYQRDKYGRVALHHNVVLDWPKKAMEKWSYLPKVKYMNYPDRSVKTGNHRRSGYWVTFSAPKLLYGNNIEEVIEEQFDEVVDLLYEQLRALNLPIEITKTAIERARVRRIDYGKNTMIAELVPMGQFCDMLMHSEHVHRSKYTQIQYWHGYGYKENIKHRSIIIYDKLAEFSSNTKNPANVREQFFLSAEKAHLFQIFRLEVQIQNSTQIALELKQFGLSGDNLSFGNIFSEEIAHTLLMKYWKNIIKRISPEKDPFSKDQLLTTFNNMVIKGSKTPQGLFAAFGLSYLAAQCGLENVKDIFYKAYDSQAWSRIRKLYEEPKLDKGLYSFISSMEKIIDTMEPLQFGKEEDAPNFE